MATSGEASAGLGADVLLLMEKCGRHIGCVSRNAPDRRSEKAGEPLLHSRFLILSTRKLRSVLIVTTVVAFFGASSFSTAVSADSVIANQDIENASRVFEAAKGRIYQIRTLTQDGAAENSTGSGFLVSQDGLIATNWHVVSSVVLEPGTYRIEAVSTDGRHIPVSVVAIDSMSDLALLKASGETGAPFALRRSPLARGDKGFSLGNPKGIGFTVVEGTFNGAEEKSLTGHYHFTAPINAGMSGGPALVSSGDVFGINVARRSDGDSMGLLVPAGKLATLIAKPRKSNPAPDALLSEARQGMIDGQEKITSDILGALPRMQQIGPFTLPVEPGSASRCRGSSNSEDDDGYALESISCLATLPISAGRKQLVGIFATDYRVIRNLRLDPVRFAARLSDQFANDKDDGGDRKILGSYECRTSFVTLKGGTARASLCTRHYRQLDGLMDAHVRLVTVDSSDVGLVGELTLRGFTESNIKRLARWYLESIEWKR